MEMASQGAKLCCVIFWAPLSYEGVSIEIEYL